MESHGRRLSVEVCLTPRLFDDILTEGPCVIVLADILRATTSICYAFMNGAEAVIPVASVETARKLKKQGYLVATEQDGKKLDFADFGNSAFSFTREKVEGRTLVYCTTNGTRALEIARKRATVAIGSFSNLAALKEWLVRQRLPVVILCSGWKNKFCLEDTLFAGALSILLLEEPEYLTACDSTHAAMDLYRIASPDPVGYINKAMHRERLRLLGLDDVIPYSFVTDTTRVVPVLHEDKIINMNLSK